MCLRGGTVSARSERLEARWRWGESPSAWPRLAGDARDRSELPAVVGNARVLDLLSAVCSGVLDRGGEAARSVAAERAATFSCVFACAILDALLLR
jgi:hypothetical protein